MKIVIKASLPCRIVLGRVQLAFVPLLKHSTHTVWRITVQINIKNSLMTKNLFCKGTPRKFARERNFILIIRLAEEAEGCLAVLQNICQLKQTLQNLKWSRWNQSSIIIIPSSKGEKKETWWHVCLKT